MTNATAKPMNEPELREACANGQVVSITVRDTAAGNVMYVEVREKTGKKTETCLMYTAKNRVRTWVDLRGIVSLIKSFGYLGDIIISLNDKYPSPFGG